MILAIDIGNTRVKQAVFEQDKLVEQFHSSYQEIFTQIENILKLYPKIAHFVVSSVKKHAVSDFEWVDKNIKINFVSAQSYFPFTNKYKTPLTLGVDRLILASGAVLRYPQKNRLIIDAGTAITYDFIDQDNNYLGGAISPGINLRYKSLNDHTDKLPLLENNQEDILIGQSTSESIHSGVLNGVVFEIDSFIERYQNEYDNFIIILTGGDSDFLAKRLKSTIFANRNFLLESLNDLHQYQQNND